MKDVSLDLRVKKILHKMCLEDNYITISEIANALGVSSRTVLRELPSVEKWLNNKGFYLKKKTGVGIKIMGTRSEKNKLINILNDEKGEINYSPEERQVIIISELLKNNEPAKLYNFTRILKVTEGTVSNDLDKVEEWLVKHHIELIRKPGLGVYIKAKEEDIRKAIVDIIFENIGEDRLLALIRNNLPQAVSVAGKTEVEIRNRLLNLMNVEVIRNLITVVRNLEKNIGYRLADNAYVGIIVHVALVIQRIKKNETIKIDEKFLEDLKKNREYSMARELCEEVADMFNIDIPEEEVSYIAMHIKGSKNYEESHVDGRKVIGNFELVKLSKEVIKIAESETGRFLGHNERLLVGLVNHLGPALSRLKMNMEIRNPLLDEIKTHYSHLYKLGEKCSAPLEKFIGSKMPDSEIAYIAMHLGAAIEGSESVNKHIYRIAIACTSGIGTSRLLATRIEREYENIEITDIVSTLNLEEEWLREKGIDFIVSTVNIAKAPVPVVTVNPLLFEEDKAKIDRQIKNLEGSVTLTSLKRKGKRDLKERLLILNTYSDAIIQILDNFFLITDKKYTNIDEIINEASEIIVSEKEQREKLKEAIKEREEKGGTFITGHGILLLHSRTAAVDRLYFGVVRPDNGISIYNARNEKEKLELAVIMVAPENCDKRFIETISFVSRMLLERPDFTKTLKSKTEEVAFQVLNNILEEFYKIKRSKYMEG
ncbi:BglG family transcription antiterminator [Clostridium thermarum]|uniref:BglG family transcription antiterminator n=1 Tax=Clostridium thermarum TaxID=1716543 RepID=UPI00111F9FEF|nr:PRD domain-containing protein [Clostridium thermarum]